MYIRLTYEHVCRVLSWLLTDARGFSPPPAAPFPKQVMQGYARKLARHEPVSKTVRNILSSEGVERSKPK